MAAEDAPAPPKRGQLGQLMAGDVVPMPFPGVNSMMYLPPELYKMWLAFGQNPGMSTQQSQPSIYPWNPGLGWSPSFGTPANK